MKLFVLCAAALYVAHAQVCKDLGFVVKPSTGYDTVHCIEDEDSYDEATISGGAYVALKSKGSFPYSFEAGLQVGAKGSGTNLRITAVIGSEITNDDKDGICINPYVALKTPEQKLGSHTIAKPKNTGRMNLFGEKGIFGGKKLCAPQGSIKWCLKDIGNGDFKWVSHALGIMGASACLSLESVIIDGQGGSFRVTMGVDLLHEAIFRAAVEEDCKESDKGVCKWWVGKSVEESTNEIVQLWVSVRDNVVDKDHREFSKTLNLGKMIKDLVEKQTTAKDGRRHLHSHSDESGIKDDGALCFGDCSAYERANGAVTGFTTSSLAWVFAIFALYQSF
jgi:hypothetical protein